MGWIGHSRNRTQRQDARVTYPDPAVWAANVARPSWSGIPGLQALVRMGYADQTPRSGRDAFGTVATVPYSPDSFAKILDLSSLSCSCS
jgi:hypothetical protein